LFGPSSKHQKNAKRLSESNPESLDFDGEMKHLYSNKRLSESDPESLDFKYSVIYLQEIFCV
jgi:hypothetical protein